MDWWSLVKGRAVTTYSSPWVLAHCVSSRSLAFPILLPQYRVVINGRTEPELSSSNGNVKASATQSVGLTSVWDAFNKFVSTPRLSFHSTARRRLALARLLMLTLWISYNLLMKSFSSGEKQIECLIEYRKAPLKSVVCLKLRELLCFWSFVQVLMNVIHTFIFCSRVSFFFLPLWATI